MAIWWPEPLERCLDGKRFSKLSDDNYRGCKQANSPRQSLQRKRKVLNLRA